MKILRDLNIYQHNSTGSLAYEMAVMVQLVRAINDKIYAMYEQDSTWFEMIHKFPRLWGGVNESMLSFSLALKIIWALI